MPPHPVDRRAVLSGLGAGALGATLGLGASPAPVAAQTWMRIDGARVATPRAWEAMLGTARRLGLDAVTVDSARLSSADFASRLGRFIPAARRAGFDVHADLGDLAHRALASRPQPLVALDEDSPQFARTPHHRLSDPAAEALRHQLDSLLDIPGLACVQLALHANGPDDLHGLIRDHVIAPARLRGKVVTARVDRGPAPGAWSLDGVFRTVFPDAGYTLLRQDLA